MRAAVAVGAMVTALLVVPIAPSAPQTATRPHLNAYDLTPLSIRGSQFHAGEHLRVVATAKRTFVRRLDANANGRFRLVLHGARLGECDSYSVRAYHGGQLRAAIKNPPKMCGADPGPN